MAEFNYTNEFNQVRELVFPENQIKIDTMSQDELKAHWIKLADQIREVNDPNVIKNVWIIHRLAAELVYTELQIKFQYKIGDKVSGNGVITGKRVMSGRCVYLVRSNGSKTSDAEFYVEEKDVIVIKFTKQSLINATRNAFNNGFIDGFHGLHDRENFSHLKNNFIQYMTEWGIDSGLLTNVSKEELLETEEIKCILNEYKVAYNLGLKKKG